MLRTSSFTAATQTYSGPVLECCWIGGAPGASLPLSRLPPGNCRTVHLGMRNTPELHAIADGQTRRSNSDRSSYGSRTSCHVIMARLGQPSSDVQQQAVMQLIWTGSRSSGPGRVAAQASQQGAQQHNAHARMHASPQRKHTGPTFRLLPAEHARVCWSPLLHWPPGAPRGRLGHVGRLVPLADASLGVVVIRATLRVRQLLYHDAANNYSLHCSIGIVV